MHRARSTYSRESMHHIYIYIFNMHYPNALPVTKRPAIMYKQMGSLENEL